MDDRGRIRMDDLELAADIQQFVSDNWSDVREDNLEDQTDFVGYRRAFLQLHGFEVPGIDYEAEVDPDVELRLDVAEKG